MESLGQSDRQKFIRFVWGRSRLPREADWGERWVWIRMRVSNYVVACICFVFHVAAPPVFTRLHSQALQTNEGEQDGQRPASRAHLLLPDRASSLQVQHAGAFMSCNLCDRWLVRVCVCVCVCAVPSLSCVRGCWLRFTSADLSL